MTKTLTRVRVFRGHHTGLIGVIHGDLKSQNPGVTRVLLYVAGTVPPRVVRVNLASLENWEHLDLFHDYACKSHEKIP